MKLLKVISVITLLSLTALQLRAQSLPTRIGATTLTSIVSIPGYVAGKSALIDGNPFRGTYNGIYIGFIANPDMSNIDVSNPASIKFTTNINKLHGSTWTTSVQDRLMQSMDPVLNERELNSEMTFYWSGPMTVDEITKVVSSGNIDQGMAGKYGLYTKNNSGNVPEMSSNLQKSAFFHMVTDNALRPSLYGLGTTPLDDMAAGDMSVNLYISQAGHTAKGAIFKNYNLNLGADALGEAHMIASDKKGDAFVWIGLGTKIIKATVNGELTVTDLAKFGATSGITKMAVSEGELWILSGNTVYRMRDGAPVAYYKGAGHISSFAVDNSSIYTTDGFKTSKSLKKSEPIFGDKPFMATQNASYLEAKAAFSSGMLEMTKNPTDQTLYLFSPAKGKVYLIQK